MARRLKFEMWRYESKPGEFNGFKSSGEYADDYQDGKLNLWGPIDDELRTRVMNGEGTAADAERLLKELEPHLFKVSIS